MKILIEKVLGKKSPLPLFAEKESIKDNYDNGLKIQLVVKDIFFKILSMVP